MMRRAMIKHATQIWIYKTWQRALIDINSQPQVRKSIHHFTRPHRTNEGNNKFYLDSGSSFLKKLRFLAMYSRNISKDSTIATSSFNEKKGKSSAGIIITSAQHVSSTGNLVHEATTTNHGTGLCSKSRPINPALNEVKLFYFDTLRLANKFQENGFTQHQAICLVEAFEEILNISIEHQTKNLVTKFDQEIVVQQLAEKIDSVKKDWVIINKSEFTMLRNDTDTQSVEIIQIKLLFAELIKLKGNLDMERCCAVKAYTANQRALQLLNSKIDSEETYVRTMYENNRNYVMKYAFGTVLSLAAINLFFIELMT